MTRAERALRSAQHHEHLAAVAYLEAIADREQAAVAFREARTKADDARWELVRRRRALEHAQALGAVKADR